MKKSILCVGLMLIISSIIYSCSESEKKSSAQAQQASSASMAGETTSQPEDFNGFKTQVELGAHLIATGGCDDCHSPKKMTERGPIVDSTLRLSGHPAAMPAPDFAGIKQAQAKGFAITQTLTAWVGPWGTSYAANLTSDATGIGNWTEQQFIKALREGKFKGMDDTRPIMPPMPWQNVGKSKDKELKAMFAYLKSLKPIKNVVPSYQPPSNATAAKK